jgi:fatty-acyl-CoA synthase
VVSYPDLWLEARRRAHALLARASSAGSRRLILPEPDEFVLTFIAALTAGVVAVPIFPPQTLAKMEAYGDTVRHVLAASGATVLITNDALRPLIEQHLVAGHSDARVVVERDVRGPPASKGKRPSPCSRGSGLPPVHLRQHLAPQGRDGDAREPEREQPRDHVRRPALHPGEDRGVSWLPLYHDMGLIGFVIAPLYALVQVMFLPTMAFIRRPSLWLEAIHRFRGTITFAPNFAFALATRAVTETQAKSWDLSCMRALGCGAEPIQADVLRAFLGRFQRRASAPRASCPRTAWPRPRSRSPSRT